MKIRKISKCFGDSTQYIITGHCNAIVAVFFKDNHGLIYRVHYLTQTPSEIRRIQEMLSQ